MTAFEKIRAYYYLTKPGIVRGNLVWLTGGFLLASRGQLNFVTFLGVFVGTGVVIASACVVNNYLDRSIDEKMERTRKRALVVGSINVRSALVFAATLGIIGFALLIFYTNLLTTTIGIIAYIFYVVIYGIAKRASYHGTLVGTIPGALPPVAGYVAVTGRIDFGAILIFLILVFWQMPHFYAIAIYRRKEYKNAGIPVVSVAKGLTFTKRAIMWYILAFMVSVICLFIAGYTGLTYLVAMLVIGTAWFVLGLRGFRVANTDAWARRMFRFSLLVTLIFSIMISVDNLLI